jgi:hypothetical protein
MHLDAEHLSTYSDVTSMHVRRARSTRKSGFPMAFSGPPIAAIGRADTRVCPYSGQSCVSLPVEFSSVHRGNS